MTDQNTNGAVRHAPADAPGLEQRAAELSAQMVRQPSAEYAGDHSRRARQADGADPRGQAHPDARRRRLRDRPGTDKPGLFKPGAEKLAHERQLSAPGLNSPGLSVPGTTP